MFRTLIMQQARPRRLIQREPDMNQRPQPKPALASAAPPKAAVSTPLEARKLAEELMDVMSALLGVIERETELVRAGKVREAMTLGEEKSELSRRYVGRGRTI